MTAKPNGIVAERRTPSESPEPPVSARHTIATVLRLPRFALLVLGQTVSQLGDKLHHMALIALVGAGATRNTGGLELAKLSIVFTAPVVLFGPLVGALVDRWNKRVTMVLVDVLRAVIVALIPSLFAATGHLWPVYIAAFFVFLLGLFFNSAKMALIPELVDHEQLLPANAALTSIGRFATVAGIVGGGVIIGWSIWGRFGWSNYAAGFYLDATSFAVSAITLLLIMLRSPRSALAPAPGASVPHGAAREEVKRSLGHLVGDVRDTLRLVREHGGLRFVYGTLVLLSVFASTVYVAMTVSVQTVMGRGTAGVGYLGGILAAGMIVGSLLLGTIGSHWDKRHTILLGTAIIGLMMVLGGSFFSYAMFAPVAFVGGALLAPVMVSQDTLLHELAPANARGVIFSTKDLILGAVFMLSALFVGAGIYLLGRLGVEDPYRLALIVLGVLISAAAVAGEIAVLRRARAAH